MLTARTMIIASAATAVAIVLLADPSHSGQTVGGQTVGVEQVKLQDRHPAISSGDGMRNALDAQPGYQTIQAPAATPKSDRLYATANCDRVTWPNIPGECLTIANSGNATAKVRTVSIDQRTYNNLSVVTPGPSIVAQR